MNPTGVIFKLLIFSALLSVAIKYAAPSLAIANTNQNALIAVLLPTIVMAIALGWRAWKAGGKAEV
ncbi:MAG: hypothetical protein KME15_19245 [Drouetiella hepatica Uher 2000/2452]|jgi:glucose-6-phosphate-specific signal transduction histidine kinase|uniref:Uncharacterized protein n=1 Tax=Drouetiella hepatica Uher 2000/2452 TaxID=904376 RepID=A0A951UNJ9_9CYAN|nr:hypothetical protein [Drouetiella hepatica Uher 2000/2452]